VRLKTKQQFMGGLSCHILWPGVVDKLCHGEIIGPPLLLFRNPEMQVLVGSFTGTIHVWVESSADVLFDMEEAHQFFGEMGCEVRVSIRDNVTRESKPG
jgi:hypothetical protein